MSTQISLRIHYVKCVDETGGSCAEKFGNAEIYLGGFGVDANGQPVKVPEAEVYKDFDYGDVKSFSPPRRFVTLPLNHGGGGSVTVGFLMVEQADGGMSSALDKLYAKVVEEMNKKKIEEVTRRRVMNLAGLDIDWGRSGSRSRLS